MNMIAPAVTKDSTFLKIPGNFIFFSILPHVEHPKQKNLMTFVTLKKLNDLMFADLDL